MNNLTENNQKKPLIRRLLYQIERTHIIYAVISFLVLIALYFLASYIYLKDYWAIGINFILALIPNIVIAILGVIFSFLLLKEVNAIRVEEQETQLVSKITESINAENEKLISKVQASKEQVQLLDGKPAIYDGAIELLKSGSWKKICLFAPVGLWRKDKDKVRWMEELSSRIVSETHNGTVDHVWGIFGLPPRFENINGVLKPRQPGEIERDLIHFQHMICTYFNDLSRVTLHYIPPVPYSVGLGIYIFEKEDDTGLFALAFASHEDREIVDVGISFDHREINQIHYRNVREWFEDKIFISSTSGFILHDSKVPFMDRWNDIKNKWYYS